METVISLRQKNPKQQGKSKKRQQQQPLKVVYISNPLRVETSASNFKGLVQQLTGRDSDIDSDIEDIVSKFSVTEPAVVPRPDEVDSSAVRLQDSGDELGGENAGNPFDVFDDFFAPPQVMDGLEGLVANANSSSLCYGQFYQGDAATFGQAR